MSARFLILVWTLLTCTSQQRWGLGSINMVLYSLYTIFTSAPPKGLQKKVELGFSKAIDNFVSSPRDCRMHPLFGVLRRCLGSRSPFFLSLPRPPIFGFYRLYKKPVMGWASSPLTWIQLTHPIWRLHTLFQFYLLSLFSFIVSHFNSVT